MRDQLQRLELAGWKSTSGRLETQAVPAQPLRIEQDALNILNIDLARSEVAGRGRRVPDGCLRDGMRIVVTDEHDR